MREVQYVRRQDWWDCLVLGGLAPETEQQARQSLEAGGGGECWGELGEELLCGADGGNVALGLRRLGLSAALVAVATSPAPELPPLLAVSLGAARPLLLQPLSSDGKLRLPAERFRPVLLQSRWVHCNGAPWSLPVLREASVRGIPTSLALPPGWDPESGGEGDLLAEHLRYAGTVFCSAAGAGPERPAGPVLGRLTALIARLAGQGPTEVVLGLDEGGCLLREESGELTFHPARDAAGATEARLDRPGAADALVAGFIAARRQGIRPRRAVVWGLLAAGRVSSAPELEPAALLDRAALDRSLLKTSWEALVLGKGTESRE